MRTLDWVVLVVSLVFVMAYGIWRGRGSDTTHKYLLAGKTMPWYAMALSIMATRPARSPSSPPPAKRTSTACASCSSISDCRSR